MLTVHPVVDNKSAFVESILDNLPAWFGVYDATRRYIKNAASLVTFGCEDETGPVGVITLRKHFGQTLEIDVMGIVPRWHRKGVGRALIEAAVEYAKGEGVTMLTVKTLGPSREDENYAATRMFYESVGFVALEEFKDLWDDNPCLFMARLIL